MSPAGAVRAFTLASGKPSPDTPTVWDESAVAALSKLVLEEVLELNATVKTSEDAKSALADIITNAVPLKQVGFIDGDRKEIDVVAAQCDAMVDIDYYMLNVAAKKGINMASIFDEVHAANMVKASNPDAYTPPNTTSVVKKMFQSGSWPSPSQGTPAEAVRAFTAEAGSPTPDTPAPITEAEVESLSKLIIEQLLELSSTMAASDKAKAALTDVLSKAAAFPKEGYIGEESGSIEQVAQQAEALVNIRYYMLKNAAENGCNMSTVFDVVHAANMAKRSPDWQPPNIEGEIARQFREGAWPAPAAPDAVAEIYIQTPAEAVRDFVSDIGKETPNSPTAMDQGEVDLISKMILDQVLELLATVKTPQEAKTAVLNVLKNAAAVPKGVFSGEAGEINQVAAQAGALVDIKYYMLNCAAKKGVNMSAIFDVLHAANLALRNPSTGFYELDEAGEIIKPKGWEAAKVDRAVARQFVEGSWNGQDSQAEAVRAFTAGSGKPTPETPAAMTEEEVQAMCKTLLEELLELQATVSTSWDSKATLIDMVSNASFLPKDVYGNDDRSAIVQVASQALALADIDYFMLHCGARKGFDMSAIFTVVHAANMDKAAPNVEGEVVRQLKDGWRTAPAEAAPEGAKTPAEKVREFTFASGKPIPDTPAVMAEGEVDFLSQMILEEMLELWATVKTPQESKAAVIAMLSNAESMPKGIYSGGLGQVAAQVDALADIEYYMLNCAATKGVNLSAIFDVVHAALMARTPPNVEREVARQVEQGSFSVSNQGTPAEAVREFTSKSGKPTPSTPQAMTAAEVEVLSFTVLTEVMELMATYKTSEESKAALIGMVKAAEALPKETYGDDNLVAQVAAQAGSLSDIRYYMFNCGAKKGFNMSAIFAKVHAANMQMASSEKAEESNFVRAADWKPVDVEAELRRQSASGAFDFAPCVPEPSRPRVRKTAAPSRKASEDDVATKDVVVPVGDILKFDDPAWKMLASRGLAKDGLLVLRVVK